MVIVWGSVVVSAQHREELIRISRKHVQRSRKEPGCLMHSVQFDVEDHNRVVFYEEWEDMAALQVHFKVPESVRFVENVGKLASGPPVMKIFEASQLR